jgi:alginate O-acetyltransferase complex protein AlgI
MLFNSFSFIFLFFPVCIVLYYTFGALSQRGAQAWLGLASIAFYSWIGYRFLPLMLGSIVFNYAVGRMISRSAEGSARARLFLTVGVVANLLVLVYYKYLFDLTGWLADHGGPQGWSLGSAVLPLGISFFTFTQIGFLVDSASGLTRTQNFVEYVLFVTFFPHVIAGPILHHREMMPQFRKPETYRFDPGNFSVGLSMFLIGLGKKVLLADHIFAAHANAAFNPGQNLSCSAAWFGEVSYFFQLYFDFSGYSEMALGLARMFNVTFPVNFDSPYKATNVIDFWQRWHVSLTRFLTLYVYSPVSLVLNRRLSARGVVLNGAAYKRPGVFAAIVAFPTVLTMTLSGIWHGSGAQFLVFGALHGLYLTVAHAWRIWVNPRLPKPQGRSARALDVAWKTGLTCVAVMVGQVFFRAASVPDALHMLASMVGQGGHDRPINLHFGQVVGLLAGFAIVWLLPNILQIFGAYAPALSRTRSKPALISIVWRPTALWGAALALLFAVLLLNLGGTSEFLYFRF